MGRTYFSTCSGVPCPAIVGAASSRPRPPGAPSAPNSAIVFETSTASPRESPRPYASSGSVGADQPASPRRSHHSATVRSGSQFSSSQARTSSTTSMLVEAGRSVVSVIRTASLIRANRSAPNRRGSTGRLRRQRYVATVSICRYRSRSDLRKQQEFHERRIHHRHRRHRHHFVHPAFTPRLWTKWPTTRTGRPHAR